MLHAGKKCPQAQPFLQSRKHGFELNSFNVFKRKIENFRYAINSAANSNVGTIYFFSFNYASENTILLSLQY